MKNTNKVQKKLSKRIAHAIFVILIVAFLLIEIFPLIWMLLSSFKTTNEFATKSMLALPEGLHFANYEYAWTIGKIGILFKNTVIVTVASLFFCVVFSVMAGFAISKMRWKFSKLFDVLFRLGMFIPPFVLLVPQYMLFSDLGLINTYAVLIIIFSSHVSLGVYLMVGFYRYIPNDILEASVIDGCGIYKLFWHIVLPLSKNGITTVLMMSFFSIWNNLLISQTFTSSTSKKMLQAGLATYMDAELGLDWGATFAAISIATIPTVLLYLLLSRHVIAGVTEGSVKG